MTTDSDVGVTSILFCRPKANPDGLSATLLPSRHIAVLHVILCRLRSCRWGVVGATHLHYTHNTNRCDQLRLTSRGSFTPDQIIADANRVNTGSHASSRSYVQVSETHHNGEYARFPHSLCAMQNGPIDFC